MIGQFKVRQKTNAYRSMLDLAVARSGFNQIANHSIGDQILKKFCEAYDTESLV